MKKLSSLLLFILITICSQVTLAQESQQKLYRIFVEDFSKIKSIESLGVSVVDMKPGISVDILALPEQVMNLGIEGVRVEFIANSFKELYQEKQGLKTSPPFHNYLSTLNELSAIAAGHPDITQLDTIGFALSGLAILCIKISDNPMLDEDEPPVLIVGNHHGNEVQSVEVTLSEVNYLVDNYGQIQEVTDWVNGMELWFVPMVNPDGREAMRRTNNHDVDLNRNYSFAFTPGGGHGTAAFSEPETRAIRDLTALYPPVMSLSYHTSGEYFLHPWTHTDLAAPDSAALVYLGNILCHSVTGEAGTTTYTLMQGGRWYFTPGEYDDYMYVTHNTLAYTVEMGTSQAADYSLVPQLIEHNLNGFKTMLRQVKRAGVTGLITDGATGLPLVATIDIPAIDGQGKLLPRMADSLYGRYYRYLAPGTYTMMFSAPGYESITREVTIYRDSLTYLNIPMGGAPCLELAGLRIDDTSGNHNGLPENGETATVELFLKNTGLKSAHGITADIRSDDAFILISPDIYQIDSLAAGETGRLTLTATFSSDTPETHRVRCTASLLTTEGYRVTLSFGLQNFLGFKDDFESGENGWVHQSYGTAENIQDDWQRGTPAGKTTDPDRAYSGTNCWGNDLGWESYQGEWWDGNYQGMVYNYLRSPEIDCSGFTGTGLKLMRWLNTQLNDLGRIRVNGELIWASPDEGLHDTVWTPQIIDISEIADGNSGVTVTFELKTNRAVHDGGWNIDDVVVANGLFAGSSIDETDVSRMPVRLDDAFPSPFNSMATIRYYIRDGGPVELKIIDQTGRTVKTLVTGYQSPGYHDAVWYGTHGNGQAAASGTYLYRLSAGNTILTKRLILLK